jgi:hypothetical protein
MIINVPALSTASAAPRDPVAEKSEKSGELGELGAADESGTGMRSPPGEE